MQRWCILGFVLFAQVLAEGPAAEQNASDPVAEAVAAKQTASQHAEARIEELHQWNAQLKQDLENKNLSLAVAQGILSHVQSSFSGKREELEQSFSAAVGALDPVALAAANSSDVEKAEEAVRDILEKMKHLNHAEAHAMRSRLDEFEKAGKAKARTLWREAKEASHHVYASGMAAARAQKEHGVHERIYERAQGETEEASEHLLGRAEEAAERAEGLVEQQSDKVEHRLERMMDDLEDKAKDALEACRQRFHHARDLVRRARQAAKEEAAKEEAAKEKAAKEEAAKEEAAKREAAKREAAKREAAKREAAKEEAAKEEAAKREAAKREAPQRDASKQKAPKEASKQEASKQEASKQEASKQEASKEGASKKEVPNPEVTKQQAVKQQASKDDATKQETSKAEQEVSPPGFLAARTSQDFSVALIAPLACAMVAAAASAAVAYRSCRRTVDTDHPMLG